MGQFLSMALSQSRALPSSLQVRMRASSRLNWAPETGPARLSGEGRAAPLAPS
jgi:hypothetical protein